MDKCIDHETCPGSKPTLKPRNLRRHPYDHYFHAYCDYCGNFRPLKEDVTPDNEVIVKHIYRYINVPYTKEKDTYLIE